MDLRGAGVIVTGGSRGLGAALGAKLASRGTRVALVAREREALERTVRGIRDRGGEAYAIVEDIGDKDAVHRIAGLAAALVGAIDVLVHNASALGPTPLRLLLDTDCEDLERVLAVNLVGPFRLTKAVAGSMAMRGRGLVVHISSDAAVNAYPRWGAYGVSKAALEQLSRTWEAELAETGAHFVSVDPGEMNTRMHADAMPDADVATLADPVDVAERITRLIEATGGSARAARLEAAAGVRA